MNLEDPSTRKRTLLGRPVTGKTKWHDLQDDLNALSGILLARPRPHFEEGYKAYDFIIHADADYQDITANQIKELCDLYGATYLIIEMN